MYGDALVDTFYNSYSSAGPNTGKWNPSRYNSTGPWKQQRSAAMFDEVELLKVTATRSDLEKFNRNIAKLKSRWGLDISASLVVPRSEEQQQRLAEQKSKKDADFLDFLFSDKIPILHDLIMHGEVETQYVRVEGSHDMVNVFNRLVQEMIDYEGMTGLTLMVTERRKIIVDTIGSPPLPTMSDIDSMFDNIFSADFSKSMPWLHKALVS